MESMVQQKKNKPVYEYTLPDELVALDDPYVKKSVGLVKLDMSEEVAASDRVKNNQARLAYNFARLALVEVDGRRVNKAEAEDESILEHTDPAIRELILAAYTDLSSASELTTKKFLASRKIKVG